MKKVASLLVLALAAIALVACGGSSNSEEGEGEAAGSGGAATKEAGGGSEAGGSGGGSTVKLEADPNNNIAYTKTKATAKAGEVTIDFNNPQALEHDVAIEDSSGERVGQTELVAEGSTSTSVELKPGTYTFFCTVPGHREAGMEGKLTVK